MKTKKLTFSEAYNSGFRFKRSGYALWLKNSDGRLSAFDSVTGAFVKTFHELPTDDLTANDFEIEYKPLDGYIVADSTNYCPGQIFNDEEVAQEVLELTKELYPDRKFRIVHVKEQNDNK